MRYRTFRNADPPAVVALWNEALTHRGAVELRSHTPLENAVFNKPYFDPLGFIVAEEDGRLVGFAHGGFGPTDDLSALDPSKGVVAAIAVRPDRRGRARIGTAPAGEDYLREARGDHPAGRPVPAGQAVLRRGLRREQRPRVPAERRGRSSRSCWPAGTPRTGRVNVFDRRLDTPLNIVDARFGPCGGSTSRRPCRRPGSGRGSASACSGPLEPSEFRLDDKATGQTAARARSGR